LPSCASKSMHQKANDDRIIATSYSLPNNG
jgi:hypothetical protein